MANFKTFAIYILSFSFAFLWLQAQSTNERWQERWTRWAHPEPAIATDPLPLVPLTSPSLPSYFANVNLIISPENDPVPVQNESSIAVNPRLPSVLIASAVDYRRNSSTWVYISTDGGRSWKNKNLGKPFLNWVSSNDPSVAFDATGRGYLCYGGFNVSTPRTGENGVFVAITTDNGQSWQAHIPVILHTGPQTPDSAFEDKYYITVDNCSTSPYRLTAYIPWKRVIARDSSTQIVLARSTDGGLTWSKPVAVSNRLAGSSEDTTYGQSFPLAATGPNGEVYVVWNHGPERGIGFAVSTDGGQTFSEPRIIIRYRSLGTARRIPEGVRHTLKGKVRAETYPVLVCDTLGGERNGYLYLCWAADSIPSVYFSRSTDGGLTWSTPKIVHSDDRNDQFWPWMAQDPITGALAIMYLDSRDDPDNILTHTYVSLSTDGGQTWVDRRVSDIASDIRRNPFAENSFAGDYSGCAFYDGKIYPSWIDTRNTIFSILDNDVYSAVINIRAPVAPDTLIATILPDQPTALQLSWPLISERVFGQPLDTNDYYFVLYRDQQRIALLPGAQTSYRDTGLVPFEPVEYTLIAVAGQDSSVPITTIGYPGGAKALSPPRLAAPFTTDHILPIAIQLPTKRADNQTPLTNLAAVHLYRDSLRIRTIAVSATDTGQTIIVYDTVRTPAYYTYFAVAVDAMIPPNYSSPSNRLLIFAGTPATTLEESFDYPPIGYFNVGWHQTDEWFHSPPYALTESPGQRYPRRAKDTLLLFPIRLSSSSPLSFRFWHAALIHPSDTGYVEIAWNEPVNWQLLLSTNRTQHPEWQDGTMDASDWKSEHFTLSLATPIDSLLFIRFRFAAGLVGNDAGWYLDDIIIQPISSVPLQPPSAVLSLYPLPTNRWLTVELSTPPTGRPTIRSIHGKLIEPERYTIQQLTPTRWTLDLQQLEPGVYLLMLPSSSHLFWIVR